ncbi:hypothetical protein AMELA_G00243790 [Ameiurus melas]|uniref:Uncharacterized protein n=1 Tax=Ameiurus melas TaxID=219545 RepID=A0A7J5ZW74_AMEME|nr:hypothetical protein AMELA_G00243790 [Ameiurus melas]
MNAAKSEPPLRDADETAGSQGEGRRGRGFTRRRHARGAPSRPQFCLNATTGFQVFPRHL